MQPAVTVIIPCFNAVEFVAAAIRSALDSGDVAVEVIVVDDGSTDGTWEVIQGFGSQITALKQQHGGPYRARNLAAGMAKGEWIALLDADDDWLPGKLAAQLRLADAATDLVYTDRLNFGDSSRYKERQSDSVRLWEGDVFEPLLQGNFITLSSVLMRKSAFDKLGGFSVEFTGVQDWDMWLRFAAAGGRVRLCQEPLTRYRIHSGQMSHNLKQRAADRMAVLRRALASPRGKQVSLPTRLRALSNLWNLAADHAAAAGMFAEGARCFVVALCYWPANLQAAKGFVKCCLRRY